MQKDMHYYGTYAIVRATGFKPEYAQFIVYSAQFVDDSTSILFKMDFRTQTYF